MMYPFMTLNDETEIVYSDRKEDGTVKIYLETPDEKDGFHNMTCYLPSFEIKEVNGYSTKQVEAFMEIVRSKENLIMEKL
jgi:hypothetical protein|uniref:hypothetical protein n=1 Tax=Roseburia sp. TaxID=2049040 RepID=UPI003FEF91D9